MSIDVARIAGAVTRRIASREHEGSPARVIVASRVYDTDRDDLWDALTNRERIPRWFLPISGDLRLGGEYQLEGNASGEIERCDAPRTFELTWVMHGQASRVNVELSEGEDGGTLFRLEHVAHVPEDLWSQFGPGAVGIGWDQALLGLDRHLATDGADGTDDESTSRPAWLASEEGRSFVRLSSDAWAEASIEAGTEPAAAREAGERVRAMYAGE